MAGDRKLARKGASDKKNTEAVPEPEQEEMAPSPGTGQ